MIRNPQKLSRIKGEKKETCNNMTISLHLPKAPKRALVV